MTIDILPKITRSKRNQTMKIGRLLEYNMRNIFLKYHTENVVEKLIQVRPFYRKSKLNVSESIVKY